MLAWLDCIPVMNWPLKNQLQEVVDRYPACFSQIPELQVLNDQWNNNVLMLELVTSIAWFAVWIWMQEDETFKNSSSTKYTAEVK